MLYERTALSQRPEADIRAELDALRKGAAPSADLIFRDTYVLDFLGLGSRFYSESELEDAILSRMEDFLLELGDGFAFVERQNRISVDSTDYYLDLLFFHRGLNRLVAIDLKLGRFRPEHKGQMELYLRWLQKHDQRPHEQGPLGLLLCSEGNTEHLELLMLDRGDIRVAQYLTELPPREWFIEKLHRAVVLATAQAHSGEEKP